MRVLFLMTDVAGEGRGGIAKYNQDLITALCAHPDCEEVVAIPRLISDPVSEIPARLTYTIPKASKINFAKTVLRVARLGSSYQLVICAHINLLPVAVVASRMTRAPLLLVVYGIDVWQPHTSHLVKWLLKYKENHIARFISISETTLHRFVSWSGLPPYKGYVLPNAIDLTRYHPGPKPPELIHRYKLAGKNVIMTLGRISAEERYKGFDEVIEALPSVQKVFPNVVYMVVGDGADRERLEQKARESGLRESVVFTGFIPEEEKVGHYLLADAYVMPSRGEGFGFVFLEAMACGVPVVASSIDGGREAVRNGRLGAMVDPDDREGLTHAIVEALRRPRGIVPEGLDYFAYPNFEKRLHAIIEQVVHYKAE